MEGEPRFRRPTDHRAPSWAVHTEMCEALKRFDSADLTERLKDLVALGANPNSPGVPGSPCSVSALYLAAMMDNRAWVPAFSDVGAEN